MTTVISEEKYLNGLRTVARVLYFQPDLYGFLADYAKSGGRFW